MRTSYFVFSFGLLTVERQILFVKCIFSHHQINSQMDFSVDRFFYLIHLVFCMIIFGNTPQMS